MPLSALPSVFHFTLPLLRGPKPSPMFIGLKGIFLATGVLAIVMFFGAVGLLPNATTLRQKATTLPVI